MGGLGLESYMGHRLLHEGRSIIIVSSNWDHYVPSCLGWRSHGWEEIVEEGDWVQEKLRVEGGRSWLLAHSQSQRWGGGVGRAIGTW